MVGLAVRLSVTVSFGHWYQDPDFSITPATCSLQCTYNAWSATLSLCPYRTIIPVIDGWNPGHKAGQMYMRREEMYVCTPWLSHEDLQRRESASLSLRKVSRAPISSTLAPRYRLDHVRDCRNTSTVNSTGQFYNITLTSNNTWRPKFATNWWSSRLKFKKV